jgi:hypothetical protein
MMFIPKGAGHFEMAGVAFSRSGFHSTLQISWPCY